MTWDDIRGGFKYPTCGYVGFLRPILGVYSENRENFGFKFHRLTAHECIDDSVLTTQLNLFGHLLRFIADCMVRPHVHLPARRRV